MKRFSLAKYPLQNKTVFLRVDFNVPIEKGKIKDNIKMKSSLPTIKFLLKNRCKIVLATHFGRPKGEIKEEFRVNPLVKELNKLLPKTKITKLDDCIGKDIKEKIKKGKSKQIFFLENLRFYKEEEENNPAFAHSLADLAEVYVNDAFGVAHRKHASLEAITHFLPSLGGILLETEIRELSKALHPRKPAIWIMGGSKMNKVDLIKQAFKKADYILIGGALPFSFMKAKKIPTGMSKSDPNSVKIAKKIIRKRSYKKIVLPPDFIVAEKLSYSAKTEVVEYNKIQPNQIALDIGPKSVELFKRYLRKAHTIVWNGPLGYFEIAKFAQSTKEIGRLMGKLTAISICGGGETSEALRKFHLEHNVNHISTGGGAALSFLSGKKLPNLVALEKNYKKFRKKI